LFQVGFNQETYVPVIEVEHVSKCFGATKAVEDITFTVEHGEIFALLGPNGAGKTTTIRLMLGIFEPESGRVSVLGGPMQEAKKDRIGYMPEERGLYQDIALERVLIYLASLKGVEVVEARRRAAQYLERFELSDHKHKAVKELSKGMQQKAQIIATLLHEPELVIIDEPFSGLDPVNTLMVKDLLLELHRKGVTVLMSTHQMHQVEELCDRILLINHGRPVLYGDLEGIREQYAGNAVLVRSRGDLPRIPGATLLEQHNGLSRIALSSQVTPQQVLRYLIDQGVILDQFEIARPTLDEIFIRAVQGAKALL
jgi:ABC-2 type transport system ATP-binding protein